MRGGCRTQGTNVTVARTGGVADEVLAQLFCRDITFRPSWRLAPTSLTKRMDAIEGQKKQLSRELLEIDLVTAK